MVQKPTHSKWARSRRTQAGGTTAPRILHGDPADSLPDWSGAQAMSPPNRHHLASPHPAREHGAPESPAAVALRLDRAHFECAAASGTQSGHSPHPCSAFATFCRSVTHTRAVRRQRHTPVQTLLPSCRWPNRSRCAGAMGHWLCAFFPRDVCAVCVCVGVPFDVRRRSAAED